LRKYHEPDSHPNIRIDTGVEEGSEISMYYDPMISKTIAWGKTRKEALELLKTGLNQYVIQGVTHNCGFGLSICNNEAFVKGEYDTSFIPRYYPDGYHGDKQEGDHHFLAIACAKLKNIDLQQSTNVGYPIRVLNTVYATVEDIDYKVKIDYINERFTVSEVGSDTETVIDMKEFDFKYNSLIECTIKLNNKEHDYVLQFCGVTNELDYNWLYQGTKLKTRVYDEKEYKFKKFMAPPKKIDHSKSVISPMPGAIISISVKEGDSVEDGQPLLVMEAMKMQNLIKSETAGKIKKINIKPGDAVAVDAVLIEFE
jgi:propionyl-CoA carboxylase alpha chain